MRAHLCGPGAGVFPYNPGDVRQTPGPALYGPNPLWQEAAQGPGDGRPLFRRDKAPGGGLYGGAERRALEAGDLSQDRAQRGGPRPA